MKEYIKNTLHFFFRILALPLVLIYSLGRLVLGEGVFATHSQLLSLFPGKFGSYFRAGFYSMTMTKCHQVCVIQFATLFSQSDTEIEKGVYIGPQCNIGKCIIRENTLIGSGVHILSGKNQHNYSDLSTPIQQQGGKFEKIVIGEDSWVGNGSLIMANVGKKCIVGAGSVVINDLPDYSVAAGNPARIIKNRNV